MRILLVEDDRLIAEAIKQALKDESYAVDWVNDAEMALATLKSQEYGLVLLDLNLPKRSGLDILRELRTIKITVPVIIITARDSVDDRIHGLDLGADDYLIKPFVMTELFARIRAVTRRQQSSALPILTNGILTLDPATRQALNGSNEVSLSAREYALLQALMVRPGCILSRSELEDRIYGWNEEVASNAVEFLIHALRKKLGADSIKNVRGMGWMVIKSQ